MCISYWQIDLFVSLFDSFVQLQPVNLNRSKVLPLEIDLLTFFISLQSNHLVFDDLFAIVDLNENSTLFDFNGYVIPLIKRKEVPIDNDLLFLLKSELFALHQR